MKPIQLYEKTSVSSPRKQLKLITKIRHKKNGDSAFSVVYDVVIITGSFVYGTRQDVIILLMPNKFVYMWLLLKSDKLIFFSNFSMSNSYTFS